MELLQVPLHYRNKHGEQIPITANPAKVLLHHILLMEEGDWYNSWPQPPKKQSIKVNIVNLDEPLVNEIFEAYRQEVDAHKELGTPIINPNPKDAICGYIYNCYSYPLNDQDIVLPPGFITETPDAIQKKKLRRIEQRITERAENNRSLQKDELLEQYQNHLISKGVEAESKEYVEKSLEYWNEIGRKAAPLLGGVRPSRSPTIILTTPIREYNIKALRAKYRYLEDKHPDFCIGWKLENPDEDLSKPEARMKLVEAYDNLKVEEEPND